LYPRLQPCGRSLDEQVSRLIGTIAVESEVGEYSEFTTRLPGKR
jgi:hypothetical protein